MYVYFLPFCAFFLSSYNIRWRKNIQPQLATRHISISFLHAGSWLLLQPIPAASSRQFITGLRDKTNIHAHTPTTNSEAPISSTCTVSGPWEVEARLADCVLLYSFSLFYTVGSRMVTMMFTSTLCYICNHGKLINIQHVLRAHHPPATIAPLLLSTAKWWSFI